MKGVKLVFDEFPEDMEYKVVINHEEQYSIWPARWETPKGWKTVGRDGKKYPCVKYIEEVWTDMRPLRVHREMLEEIRRGG